MAEVYPPEEPKPEATTPAETTPPTYTTYSEPPGPLTNDEERTWAMLAHLSVLLNLFTAVLGPVAALVIYLMYKDRSRYVAYQSLQSLIMQLVLWIGGGILAAIVWAITAPLMVVIVGLCLLPFALLISLLPVAALVYGVVGAVQTYDHKDFQYWLIGDWVRSTYTG